MSENNVIFIDLNNTEDGKIATCKHRSKSKVNREVKACCGNKKMSYEYECLSRKIFPLTSAICDGCSVYEKI